MFSNIFANSNTMSTMQSDQSSSSSSMDLNLWLAFANIMQEFQNTQQTPIESMMMKLPEKAQSLTTPSSSSSSNILLNALAQINSLNRQQACSASQNSTSSEINSTSDYFSSESPLQQSSSINSSAFSIPALLTDEEKLMKIEESLNDDRITLPSSDSPNSLEHSPVQLEVLLSTKSKTQQTSTSGKKYTCHICSKEYHSMSALKMHIRTHTLPCRCDVCGKAFSRMWLLNGHIRTHTGEKPFSCSICNRAFADRSNLRAHMQTHSDVKRYRCQKCGKTFSRMGLLTKHKNTNCTGKLTTTTTTTAVTTTTPMMHDQFSIAFLAKDGQE